MKLCHELREAQRHALILARHRAQVRLAMFILMLARSQEARNENETDIYLPMTRSDIADYLGLTLATVSRSFRMLEGSDFVRFSNRRHLRILSIERGCKALLRRMRMPANRANGEIACRVAEVARGPRAWNSNSC